MIMRLLASTAAPTNIGRRPVPPAPRRTRRHNHWVMRLGLRQWPWFWRELLRDSRGPLEPGAARGGPAVVASEMGQLRTAALQKRSVDPSPRAR
jgi:hypothetical protein